jgi:hypothetical protein
MKHQNVGTLDAKNSTGNLLRFARDTNLYGHEECPDG